jgi:hypothetical protein
MEDTTDIINSATNHKTATLVTAGALLIGVGATYGLGKLVGGWRAKRNMPVVTEQPTKFIEVK